MINTCGEVLITIKKEHIECPYCKEDIKAVALKCKHCHSHLRNNNIDNSNKSLSGKAFYSNIKSPLLVAIILMATTGMALYFWLNTANKAPEPVVEPWEITEMEVDEWVEASNFVTSKVDGLTWMYEKSIAAEITTEEGINELRSVIEAARSKDPPYLFRDMYDDFLEGIDVLEQGTNHYESGDDYEGIINILNGLKIMLDARSAMFNRVQELAPFDND